MARNHNADQAIKAFREQATEAAWQTDTQVIVYSEEEKFGEYSLSTFLSHGFAYGVIHSIHEEGNNVKIEVYLEGQRAYSRKVKKPAKPIEVEFTASDKFGEIIPQSVREAELRGEIKVQSAVTLGSIDKLEEKHKAETAISKLQNQLEVQETAHKTAFNSSEKEKSAWKGRAVKYKKETEELKVKLAGLEAKVEMLSPLKNVIDVIQGLAISNPALIPTVLAGFAKGDIKDLLMGQAAAMSGLGGFGQTPTPTYAPEIQQTIDFMVSLSQSSDNSYRNFWGVVQSIMKYQNDIFQYYQLVLNLYQNDKAALVALFHQQGKKEAVPTTEEVPYEEVNN